MTEAKIVCMRIQLLEQLLDPLCVSFKSVYSQAQRGKKGSQAYLVWERRRCRVAHQADVADGVGGEIC